MFRIFPFFIYRKLGRNFSSPNIYVPESISISALFLSYKAGQFSLANNVFIPDGNNLVNFLRLDTGLMVNGPIFVRLKFCFLLSKRKHKAIYHFKSRQWSYKLGHTSPLKFGEESSKWDTRLEILAHEITWFCLPSNHQ